MAHTPRELTAVRLATMVGALGALSVAAALACAFVGYVPIAWRQTLAILAGARPAGAEVELDIVLNQRLPRVALAFMAGGALAVAGAVFQALLRNPLATPHTLGVSAGGALGASVAMFFGLSGPGGWPVGGVQLLALAGSLCVVALIYALSRHRARLSTFKLLLAGVTLSLVCSAVIMFVRYLAEPNKLVILDRWLMGGLAVRGYSGLNQLLFGEELAAGRGVNVGAVQAAAFIAGSVLTASVVSVAGPIGFVGLIVPHVFRMIVGPDHRVLLFASFFGGGAFLTVADTLARTLFAPTELPVGVLTAMMGGPFFLALLVGKARL